MIRKWFLIKDSIDQNIRKLRSDLFNTKTRVLILRIYYIVTH